jgi:hypothetical protein
MSKRILEAHVAFRGVAHDRDAVFAVQGAFEQVSADELRPEDKVTIVTWFEVMRLLRMYRNLAFEPMYQPQAGVTSAYPEHSKKVIDRKKSMLVRYDKKLEARWEKALGSDWQKRLDPDLD